METTAEATIIGVSALTVVGDELQPLAPDVALTPNEIPDEELMYLQPPTWNESSFPYLGDLTPKPTWEIIVKVSACI